MKNKRWYVLVLMLIFSTAVTFSVEMGDLAKVVEEDAWDKMLNLMVQEGDKYNYYALFKSSFDGSYYVYYLNSFSNVIKVYEETRSLSQQEFRDKLNSSSYIQKRIDKDGFICYEISDINYKYIVQFPNEFIAFPVKESYMLNPFTANLTNDSTSSFSRIPIPNPNEPKSYKQGYLADMDSDDFYYYLYDDTDSSYDDGNDMLEYLYDEANPYTLNRILNFIKQYVSEPLFSRMVASSDESDNPSVVMTVNHAYKAHKDAAEVDNEEVWYYVFYDGNNVFLVLTHIADNKIEASYVYNIY